MLGIGVMRVVGVPPAPYRGSVIAFGVLFSQPLDLLIIELVPRRQDDNRLFRTFGYVTDGGGANCRRLAAAHRRYQQHDRRSGLEDLAC